MVPLAEVKIAVIGLGYVGLPLAVEFGKKFVTVGYDINSDRLSELAENVDSTLEVSSSDLKLSSKLSFCSEVSGLKHSSFYIVTVPTPINQFKQPDLGPLISASGLIGEVINAGDIVVFESTVYPGATEEECIPIIERISGLKLNEDFYAGYSPERINPGDKTHRLVDIVKVTSGSDVYAANYIDDIYSSIITAGTYKASSIKVAEAAKVIENTQRDLNIGLINELAMIFARLGIDTDEVLKAAGTKWNFLPFKPGLVGGHCIGVDPYYLTHKAEAEGYAPELILAGRRINENMPKFVASQLIKKMAKNGTLMSATKVLILGFTFKEDCPDIRNTKVVDLITELEDYGVTVDCFDPHADVKEVERLYGISLIHKLEPNNYSGVVIAVGHKDFDSIGRAGILSLSAPKCVIYDLKHILPLDHADMRL